jgi:hypothetical protein
VTKVNGPSPPQPEQGGKRLPSTIVSRWPHLAHLYIPDLVQVSPFDGIMPPFAVNLTGLQPYIEQVFALGILKGKLSEISHKCTRASRSLESLQGLISEPVTLTSLSPFGFLPISYIRRRTIARHSTPVRSDRECSRRAHASLLAEEVGGKCQFGYESSLVSLSSRGAVPPTKTNFSPRTFMEVDRSPLLSAHTTPRFRLKAFPGSLAVPTRLEMLVFPECSKLLDGEVVRRYCLGNTLGTQR